jgi:WD40 repeat protein
VATLFRVGDRTHGIKVWESGSGKLLLKIPGHEHEVAGITFGPGDTLYSWDLRGFTKRWDLKTGRQTWQFSALQQLANSVAFL